MADAEHLALEVVLAAGQQDVEAILHLLAQGFGINALGRHGRDRRAAIALGGIEGQADGFHGRLGGAAVPVVASKDHLQALGLHDHQRRLQGEVEVDRRGEGVAVGGGRFAVFAQV